MIIIHRLAPEKFEFGSHIVGDATLWSVCVAYQRQIKLEMEMDQYKERNKNQKKKKLYELEEDLSDGELKLEKFRVAGLKAYGRAQFENPMDYDEYVWKRIFIFVCHLCKGIGKYSKAIIGVGGALKKAKLITHIKKHSEDFYNHIKYVHVNTIL